MEKQIETAVFDRLRSCLVRSGEVIEITPQTAIHDLPLDSLTLLEIVYELEDQFGVIVDEQALVSLEKVEDLIRMVSSVVRAKGAQESL
ncbi:MAG: hypothetical protein RLZZ385_2665 [Pseudomonadota bacterium]